MKIKNTNEEIVLHLMLNKNEFYSSLDENDFNDYYCREIFKTITSLYKNKHIIDTATVANQYKDNSISQYIFDIYTDGLALQPNTYYIKLLKEETNKKQLLSKLQDASSKLINGYETKQVIQDLESHIEKINNNQKLSSVDDFDTEYSIKSLISDLSNNAEGYKTGYKDLDKVVTFKNGTINIVAARPSHGKTSMMLNLFCNMAELYQNKKFYFISYEESLKKITLKTLSILSKDFTKDIQEYLLGNKLYNSHDPNFPFNVGLKKYTEYNSTGRIRIIYGSLDIESLCYSIESLKTKCKDSLGVIFIDYIQEIPSRLKHQSRQIELHYICRQLLNVATKTDVVIVLGSQMNRGAVGGNVTSDTLREADDLLNVSNTILSIVNEKKLWEDNNPQSICNMGDSPDLDIRIMKNRDGESGSIIPLKFESEKLLIRDMTKSESIDWKSKKEQYGKKSIGR